MDRNYRVFIPHVNRPDFTHRAIECLLPVVKDRIVVIDNSDNQDFHYNTKGWSYYVEIIKPTYPLSFSQTMNLMQKIAIEQDLIFFLFMHNDATATKERINALFEKVEEGFEKEPAWAVVFTLYDILCAYRTSAIEDIGKWDVNFPQYFADNDYFRRVRLKGYKCLEAGGDGITHDASSTMRNDPKRYWANENSFPLYRELYKKKWGGYSEEETYEKPYNKLDL